MFSEKVTNLVRPEAENMEGCGGTEAGKECCGRNMEDLTCPAKTLALETYGYCILENDT